MENEQSLSGCFILELMGHNKIAGNVTMLPIGGAAMLRVDVPETKTTPSYTKYFNPSAVYAMTPTDEASMLLAAEAIEGARNSPTGIWSLDRHIMKLQSALPDGVEEIEEEDEEIGNW